MKLSEIQASTFDLDTEITDAAKAIGTAAEATPEVRARVKDLVTKEKLTSMHDGEIEQLFAKAKGDGKEKFALRIALKVVGRRDPTEQ